MEQQANLCQTLAEQLRAKAPEASADPAQLLKDLTARQTELLNINAQEEQRIAVFKEIQKAQKMRRTQE